MHKILLKTASPPKDLFERPQSPRLAEFFKSTRF
jgi:polar amino acid transport system ATP-binding protein